MKALFSVSALLITIVFSPAPTVHASVAPALNEVQRAELRTRLERLYNEVDLLVRNQQADRSDLRKQAREIEYYRLYDRIPLSEDLPGLKKDLAESARKHGFEIAELKVISRSKRDQRIPKKVVATTSSFALKPEQLAETMHLSLRMRPTASRLMSAAPNLNEWVASWPRELSRLVAAEKKTGTLSLEVRAYRFYPIEFPQIYAPDPSTVLPAWAKRDPRRFSATEPFLWSFVSHTRALLPQSPPLYANRGKFLLNMARVQFFLSEARQATALK